MIIKAWDSFTKRKNSTKRPNDSDADEIEVTLKDDTDLYSPHLILNTDKTNYNYFYFNGRYYFVSDVRFLNNNNKEFSCTLDHLATWKDNILASEQYITYCARSSTDVITKRDDRLPFLDKPVDSYMSTTGFRKDFSNHGSIVVSLTATNSVDTWVVGDSLSDVKNLRYLMPQISAQWDDSSIVDLSSVAQTLNNIFKQWSAYGSVSENIRDVRWIPFDVYHSGYDDTLAMKVGQYDVLDNSGNAVMGRRLDQGHRITTETIKIPSIKSIYPNLPWWRVYDSTVSTFVLYIPYVGILNLDPATAAFGLELETSLDRFTGDLSMVLWKTDSGYGKTPLHSFTVSTGVSLMLGSSGNWGTTMANTISTASTVSSNYATQNNYDIGLLPDLFNKEKWEGLKTAISNAFTGGSQIVKEATSSPMYLQTSVGSLGNASATGISSGINYGLISRPIACYDDISNYNVSTVSGLIGAPYFNIDRLKKHSGYVQCYQPSIEISGLYTDKMLIESSLGSGIYIE